MDKTKMEAADAARDHRSHGGGVQTEVRPGRGTSERRRMSSTSDGLVVGIVGGRDDSRLTEAVDGFVYSAMLAFFLYPFWLLLDWSNGADLATCAMIRMGVMMLLGGFIFASQSSLSKARLVGLGIASNLTIGAGVIALTVVVQPGFDSNYHAGLIMVFMIIGILSRVRPILVTVQIGILLGLYLVTALVSTQGAPSEEAVGNLLFVCGAGAISIYGADQVWRLRTKMDGPHEHAPIHWGRLAQKAWPMFVALAAWVLRLLEMVT